MYLAARLRPLDTSLLLACAYAGRLAQAAHISTLDATKIIIGAEKEYQNYCMQYAQAFCAPSPQDVLALSVLGAEFANEAIKKILPLFGIPPSVTVTVTPELVGQFVASAMSVSCLLPDYKSELAKTLSYLRGEMYSHRIASCSGWFAKGEVGDEWADSNVEAPAEFSLGDNYPNPFNPTTTITYSLASDVHVSLKVFNSLGQEIATLVEDAQPAGQYATIWDARDCASGIYYYRLQAGTFTSMRKMMLVK